MPGYPDLGTDSRLKLTINLMATFRTLAMMKGAKICRRIEPLSRGLRRVLLKFLELSPSSQLLDIFDFCIRFFLLPRRTWGCDHDGGSVKSC